MSQHHRQPGRCGSEARQERSPDPERSGSRLPSKQDQCQKCAGYEMTGRDGCLQKPREVPNHHLPIGRCRILYDIKKPGALFRHSRRAVRQTTHFARHRNTLNQSDPPQVRFGWSLWRRRQRLIEPHPGRLSFAPASPQPGLLPGGLVAPATIDQLGRPERTQPRTAKRTQLRLPKRWHTAGMPGRWKWPGQRRGNVPWTTSNKGLVSQMESAA